MDYVKLIKLLRMTEGSFDGECLNAIRKANAMLAEADINWEELFVKIVSEAAAQGGATTQQAKPKGTVYTDHDEIDAYFRNIFRDGVKGSFKTFIESVHEWWEQNGYLTEKQYNAVKKAGSRAWNDI